MVHLAASLIALLLALPAVGQQMPTYHRVVGVAANDTLSVRAAPNAKAEKVGDLAPDAAPVEITAINAEGTWGRLIYFGTDGWVSMRYLAPAEPDALAGTGYTTGLPVGLSCGGTEPFWSLTIETQRTLNVSIDPAEPTREFTIADATVAAGFRRMPVGIVARSGASELLASVSPGWCTDGMSDATYGMSTAVWFSTDDGMGLLSGCCTLRGALE